MFFSEGDDEGFLGKNARRMMMHLSIPIDEDLQQTLSFFEKVCTCSLEIASYLCLLIWVIWSYGKMKFWFHAVDWSKAWRVGHIVFQRCLFWVSCWIISPSSFAFSGIPLETYDEISWRYWSPKRKHEKCTSIVSTHHLLWHWEGHQTKTSSIREGNEIINAFCVELIHKHMHLNLTV